MQATAAEYAEEAHWSAAGGHKVECEAPQVEKPDFRADGTRAPVMAARFMRNAVAQQVPALVLTLLDKAAAGADLVLWVDMLQSPSIATVVPLDEVNRRMAGGGASMRWYDGSQPVVFDFCKSSLMAHPCAPPLYHCARSLLGPVKECILGSPGPQLGPVLYKYQLWARLTLKTRGPRVCSGSPTRLLPQIKGSLLTFTCTA